MFNYTILSSYFHSTVRMFHTSPMLSQNDFWNDVDWNRHRDRPYVVVNPGSAGNLLYLSEGQYMRLLNVTISQELTLTLVAGPGDSPDSVNRRFGRSTTAAPGSNKTGSANSPSKSQTISPGRYSAKSWFRLSKLSKWFKIRDGMIQFRDRNISKTITMWGQTLMFWLGLSRLRNLKSLYSLSTSLQKIATARGLAFLVSYMKVCLFVVNSYIAGNRMKDTNLLGLRVNLVNGLPSIIPLSIRSAIRNKNAPWIRFIQSYFNAYKAIATIYKELPIENINAPKFEGDLTSIANFTPTFFSYLNIKADSKPVLNDVTFPISLTAGPNFGVASISAFLDAHALFQDKPMFKSILDYCQLTGNRKFFEKLFDSRKFFDISKYEKKLLLGKLAIKYEPGGKVRLFAIIDYWTQRLFEPLHRRIFEILRRIPSDATFDQEGKVREFSQRGYKEFYSYDLKSATDLIPVSLYIEVLSFFIGRKQSELWIAILVNRDFQTPSKRSASRVRNKSYPDTVRYTRGQPMGALSSWAALALIHHFIVQLAAKQAGIEKWFEDYLVLGDDITIANKDVAKQYLSVCDQYGIQVGLPKSYISEEGFFNFANQSLSNSVNLSPFSLKEEIMITNINQRMEFIMKSIRRGLVEVTTIPFMVKLGFNPSNYSGISRDLTKGIANNAYRFVLTRILGSTIGSIVDPKSLPYTGLFSFSRGVNPLGSLKSYFNIDRNNYMDDLKELSFIYIQILRDKGIEENFLLDKKPLKLKFIDLLKRKHPKFYSLASSYTFDSLWLKMNELCVQIVQERRHIRDVVHSLEAKWQHTPFSYEDYLLLEKSYQSYVHCTEENMIRMWSPRNLHKVSRRANTSFVNDFLTREVVTEFRRLGFNDMKITES